MLCGDESPAELSGLESDTSCLTARDFLRHLSLAEERWAWTGDAPTWIFRGQGDADWALRPTIIRKRDALAEFGTPLAVDGVEALQAALRSALERFEGHLVDVGVGVPEPPHRGGGFFGDVPRPGVFNFAEIPTMALARHHGLPTILLDWSTRSYVGAYFAATARLRDETRAGVNLSPLLAVWALDATTDGFGERGRLTILRRVPGSTNTNMLAQSGLFTLLRPEGDDPSRNSVDGFCANGVGPRPALRRITAPASESREILRLLSAEKVTGSSMFPNPDGIVTAMRERALWAG